jgi:hypothetical protein
VAATRPARTTTFAANAENRTRAAVTSMLAEVRGRADEPLTNGDAA